MAKCLSVTGLATAVVLLSWLTATSAFPLVTEEEASRPNGFYRLNRPVTPGPVIEVLAPPPAAFVNSHFEMKIRLTPHGGATIDRDSIEMVYWKVPAVDLTQRIRQFIKGNSIDLADVEMPAGIHPLRFVVKDSRGRSTAFFFEIWVTK
jgi:hypothetical protein